MELNGIGVSVLLFRRVEFPVRVRVKVRIRVRLGLGLELAWKK